MRRIGKRPKLLAVAVPVLALGAWLAGMGPSAAAETSRHDVDATRSYLRTEIALFRTIVVNTHLGIRAGDELVADIAKECHGVVSGGHRGLAAEAAAEKVHQEAFDTVLLALLTPDLPADRQAAAALARLRWSNRRLTDLVHRRAHRESAVSALVLPDLCGDLKEWAASGYSKVPAGTRSFLAHYAVTERGGDFQDRIQHMLEPYEGAREHALEGHLERLITRSGHLVVGAFGPLLRKLVGEVGLVSVGGEPTQALIQPPASVVQEGGKRLEEFELGRSVAAQSGCLACHRIGEDGNPGPGPDLTHIGSTLTGTQIARALIHAKAPMPSFRNLPRKKFEALVEFLALLH